MTLWEHIPPHLDHQLLQLNEDFFVLYNQVSTERGVD